MDAMEKVLGELERMERKEKGSPLEAGMRRHHARLRELMEEKGLSVKDVYEVFARLNPDIKCAEATFRTYWARICREAREAEAARKPEGRRRRKAEKSAGPAKAADRPAEGAVSPEQAGKGDAQAALAGENPEQAESRAEGGQTWETGDADGHGAAGPEEAVDGGVQAAGVGEKPEQAVDAAGCQDASGRTVETVDVAAEPEAAAQAEGQSDGPSELPEDDREASEAVERAMAAMKGAEPAGKPAGPARGFAGIMTKEYQAAQSAALAEKLRNRGLGKR